MSDTTSVTNQMILGVPETFEKTIQIVVEVRSVFSMCLGLERCNKLTPVFYLTVVFTLTEF